MADFEVKADLKPEETKPDTPTAPATPKFKRNYFLNTLDTTGAEPSTPEKGKRGKKEEESKPKSEWVQFSDPTRKEMATFLDNFVTNTHEVYNRGDGREILKTQPHAEEIMRILGVSEKPIDKDNLAAKIGIALDSPQGWAMAKTLLDQQTAMQIFALGLMTSAELNKKGINPQDLLGMAEMRRIDKVRAKLGLTKIETTAAGFAVGGATGFFGTKLVEAGIIGKTEHALAEAAKFLATHAFHDKASAIGTIGAAGGAFLGWYLGGDPREPQNNSGFEVARDALLSIQKDPAYARYIEAQIGVDVNDFTIDENTKTINVNEHFSTNKIKDILNDAKSNMETRNHYYDDLGVPPADRDIISEQFILQGDLKGFERAGDRVEADIQRKFRALGGGDDKNLPDIWGNEPGSLEYRKIKKGETAKIDNFIADDWGQGPDSPWYFRADGRRMPDLPDFDPKNIRVREIKTGKLKTGIPLGAKETVQPADRWGQQPTINGEPNPFYGRVDGSTITVALPDGTNTTALDLLKQGPHTDNLDVRDGAVDKFGQKKGDPGFGREKKKKGIIKDRMAKFDKEKIDLTGILDNKSQSEGTLFFGTGVDARNIPLPDVNPLATPDGAGQPDIWGQGSSSLFYGRMDERLANSAAKITDVDVNERALVPKANAPDRWGQLPTLPDKTPNPFYGRMEQGTGDTALSLPDADETIPLTGTDSWGQKARYPDGKTNPFFRRMDENDFFPFDTTNFADENIVDIWGQTRTNPDGSLNPYFARFDKNLIPDKNWKNFPEGALEDEFGQSYFLADGTTRNPFFAREKEADLEPFSLDNFDDKYKTDKWMQSPRNPDGSKNVFFGVMDAKDIKDPIPPYELKNFRREDFIDNQGRRVGDPLFGRGKYEGNFPDQKTSKVKDLNGFSPLDAEFWTDKRPVPAPDFERFELATGLDTKDRPPGHPLFCIDADEKIPADIVGMGRDKWGQSRADIAFGIRDASELAALDNSKNLELYRQARELVLADLTEQLIVKMEATPTRSTTIIETKITERKDENGRIIKEKREKASKDAPELQGLLDESFDPRMDAIAAYVEAQKKLKEAEDKLKKYIPATFRGGITEPEEALNAIRNLREQSGTSRTFVIDGKDKTIGSIADQKDEAAEFLSREQLGVRTSNPKHVDANGNIEPEDAYEARIEPKLRRVQERYEAKINKIDEENRILSGIYGEIDDLQLSIKQNRETIAPKNEVILAREAALFARNAEDREKAWQIVGNAEVRKLLLESTPTEILKKINELHESDATFGWEEAENEDFTRDQVLAYAIATARAMKDDGDAITSFRDNTDLINAITQNVTLDQLGTLTIPELQTLLGNTLPDTEVELAQLTVKDFAKTMTKATKEMQEDLSLRIRRAERMAEEVDLKDEIDQLEVTKNAMTRQAAVFGLSAEVVSDVTVRFPLKDNHLQKLSELEEKDKKRLTKAEKDTPDDTPVAYFEFLNILFDYRGKADTEARFTKISKVLSPTVLNEILQDVAVEPFKGADLNEILFKLQDNIRKGLVTRRAVRKMFEGVIEGLEDRALALP